jgi:TM2 domain-containing membrane protein YozV
MKASFLLCIFLILIKPLAAQDIVDSSWKKELAFINHWIAIEDYNDAVYVINKSLAKNNLTITLRDSLYYLKAWSFYQDKQLDSSIHFFNKISSESSTYPKSVFFSAFCESYINKPDHGILRLKETQLDSSYAQLKNFEMAGMYLLKRDSLAFLRLAKDFHADNYQFSREENNLMEYYKRINAYKNKSMFLAGAMSAILPGSGKVYAGRLGEGISAFLLNSSMAFVAIENIRKDGIWDVKSIFFTGLFSVFYIGNIYGSVFSVQMQRQEFNNEINHNILFDLHIPLRRAFY